MTLPPMKISQVGDEIYMIDSRSPFTMKEYIVLFKGKRKGIERLASKVGLVDMSVSKRVLIARIIRRLRCAKIAEPIKLPLSVARKMTTPSEPVRPSEPSEPSRPVEPSEPTRPSEPVRPVERVTPNARKQAIREFELRQELARLRFVPNPDRRREVVDQLREIKRQRIERASGTSDSLDELLQRLERAKKNISG